MPMRSISDIEFANARALGAIDVAQSDEHGTFDRDVMFFERDRNRHPVHVPGRRRERRIDVAVRVDPNETRLRLARAPHARERPDRNRMIAPEHDRKTAFVNRFFDET